MSRFASKNFRLAAFATTVLVAASAFAAYLANPTVSAPISAGQGATLSGVNPISDMTSHPYVEFTITKDSGQSSNPADYTWEFGKDEAFVADSGDPVDDLPNATAGFVGNNMNVRAYLSGKATGSTSVAVRYQGGAPGTSTTISPTHN